MKKILFVFLLFLLSDAAYCQQVITTNQSQKEINKKIARDFYQDLWFSNNTVNYAKYVAETYVVHDIGKRKGVVEPAVEQKNIADFFWENGTLSGKIDYQVAEGDLVATRWTGTYKPETLIGKIAVGDSELPIINVLRIKDGKIVEFWNHRHDIDTPQTLKFVFQGLLLGLAIALIPTVFAIKWRRKKRILV